MRLLGIDGCRGGWVVVSSDADLSSLDVELIKDGEIGSLLRNSAECDDIVAIDMPIGLAGSAPRACDVAARRYLKAPRASSVFPPPCRATLSAMTYEDACARNRAASGRSLPIQTFHIFPKMREIDGAIDPSVQRRVRESHPELVFARLSGEERGLVAPKRSAAGRGLRQSLLEQRIATFDPDTIRWRLGRARLATDDLLDALACVIAAWHLHRGVALVLPTDFVERDQRGLRMEIVA